MDIAERNRQVEQFLPLVWKIARELWIRKQMVRRLGSVEDAAQVGVLGLMRAVELYDQGHPSGATPWTYAMNSIRNRILTVAREAGTIRVPQYLVRELEHTDGVPQTELHEHGIRAWLCAAAGGGHADPILSEWEERTSRQENTEPLRRVLARLPQRDQELLADCYGLGNRPRRRPSEVAKDLGVTDSQIHNRLRDLRARLRRDVEWELDLERLPRKVA